MTIRAGSRLGRLLHQDVFCVTAEVVPPRSSDPADVTAQARGLVGYVDAVNVTDNPTASAHMSSVAAAAFVTAAGVEPVLQLTVRDRNRLALTADLLGAWALGARNLLCLSGDPPVVGDHPDAKGVFDLDSVQLIWTARTLEMTDLRRKSRTILRLEKLEYNIPVKDDEFTIQALRREQ